MSEASPGATNPSPVRYGILFSALLLIFVAFPLLEPGSTGDFLLDLVFLGVLLSALYVVGDDKRIVVAALVPGLLMFSEPEWLLLEPSPLLAALSAFAMMAFLAVIIVALTVDVHRSRTVTFGTILGACSVYLMLGIFWYALFVAVEALEPASFSFAQGHAADIEKYQGVADGGDWVGNLLKRGQLFYFAFVTITTLGYGDITPVSEPARVYSTLAAVTGQLFIAILVARLVGMWSAEHVVRGSSSR